MSHQAVPTSVEKLGDSRTHLLCSHLSQEQTGAVAVVNIMMSVRDRAQDGDSYYENPP
jgi:hypothetical protein